MTDLNNTNDNGVRPDYTPDDENSRAELDEAWAAFEAEHRDDFADVAASRNAKRFEKHAERRDKEAVINAQDLSPEAFSPTGASHGPRDFTGSSWLDVDATMNQYGDDFVAPNPTIGPIKRSKLLFWTLLLIGITGIIATAFLPTIAGILGTAFGACTLIGAAGLIVQHKGHNETREDYFDDGARV